MSDYRKTHYLPASLLRRFDDGEGLHQINLQTGKAKRANPDNTGFVRHLYPPDLEAGLMKRIDTNASEIIDLRIAGQREVITLTDAERKELAVWMASFMIRTPKSFDFVKKEIRKEKDTTRYGMKIDLRHKRELLTFFADARPDLYQNVIDEFGEEAGINQMFRVFVEFMQKSQVSLVPEPHPMFVTLINEDRMLNFAQYLVRYQWIWLRSEYGFIISDNPLCRWNARQQRHDCGIGLRHTEISFPMGSRLTLRFRARHRRNSQRVRRCSTTQTRYLNSCQIIGAFPKLFGPKKVIEKLHQTVLDWPTVKMYRNIGYFVTPDIEGPLTT